LRKHCPTILLFTAYKAKEATSAIGVTRDVLNR